MKEESVQDSTAQCRVLITVLDHLSLLFNTSGTSGSRMVSVLLKYVHLYLCLGGGGGGGGGFNVEQMVVLCGLVARKFENVLSYFLRRKL